jgi:hypothetical protein
MSATRVAAAMAMDGEGGGEGEEEGERGGRLVDDKVHQAITSDRQTGACRDEKTRQLRRHLGS